jgi:hypothetical protein
MGSRPFCGYATEKMCFVGSILKRGAILILAVGGKC